jgi:hypothetical protein
MGYSKTTWADAPSTSSPINATNLNNIETGISELIASGFNAQTGTTYTLALTDADSGTEIVTLDNGSAIAVTVPTNTSVAFPTGSRVTLIQLGAGQVTISAAGGVTVNSQGAKTKIAGQYGVAQLVKTATDTWVLFGNLTA